MSNPDSFLNEVTEELRRDRMMGYLRKYGWIAILAVLLIVGGTGWNEWRKATERANAEAFGDAVLAALENNDPSARVNALAQIETTGAQAGMIQLLSAGELIETDRAAALAALSAASEDTALPDAYRQLAALKWVIAGGTDIPIAEREMILAGLTQPGQPLRPMALEQTALLQLEQGNPETAIEIMTDLLSQSDVSDTLRRRVTQLVVALGGEVAPR
ncbi:hypothetical protein [Roseinatronobacter bogoriensis]|uniref:Tetratricopeptide repeat-like domain-containing protein n=1 Tax=Roseinatronobacter bogoriensis subsp. barguzinensis TaxID=441209 RepID=A0A2K8KAH5_9RHOB|nr:hypothetical protein [Rhodobaca]ATX64685.1 hypothetical protein BG454_01590 [Rhodobaca barguzinensis]MBB4209474.1 hypothetical protein [Rhodobaca bogoriensis DSM 18756]TDW35160.1 hypothetical protein LY39_03254 [Rhodobaca barguzinensis]TDY66830.1 hypothetical protein EV660_10955 [Rhodobaca bogoriensis DSM 18756]